MNERFRNIEPRTYKRGACVTFQKTNEEFGGLSNMAPGFPLVVNGLNIGTSEVLYQACRFPHLVDVQRMLLAERSPMTAKMKSKPYRESSRPDFEAIKVTVMRWCLRVKLLQNWAKFERLLLATGELPIVEVSRKDPYWGALPHDLDGFRGGNVMGRLLMELRELLRSNGREALRMPLPPPPIPDFLLLGMPIGVVMGHDDPRVATSGSHVSPWAIVPAEHGVVVRVFVSCYGRNREVQNEPLHLSYMIERLTSIWGRQDDLEEVELTVRCRPGTEETVLRALRGADSDDETDDETPQQQLFARTRYE